MDNSMPPDLEELFSKEESARCKECGGASICQHNRVRHQCRDCGGEGICQHSIKSTCKECGGGGICQHKRERSRRKTCKADKDDALPPDLEEL